MPQPTPPVPSLRTLDPCIRDRTGLSRLREALQKIEKICGAVDRDMNLADILRDPLNQSSLAKAFGQEELGVGMELLARLALQDFECRSFTTRQEISGAKRVDFIYRSVGGWKQFRMTVAVQFPAAQAGAQPAPLLINPARQEHWEAIERLPAGTLVTVHLRSAQGKRSPSQEKLAMERFEAVFETVQDRSGAIDSRPAPVIEMFRGPAQESVSNGNGHAHHANGSNGSAKAAARRPGTAYKSNVPTIKRAFAPGGAAKSASGEPAMTFKVIVNKMDTFVHAGNAQLILSHLRDYGGRAAMFVLRPDKHPVQLDADSIWGAEIRNGETVLFEFFGPQPEDGFVKELAKKVNKYTQMDKIANE